MKKTVGRFVYEHNGSTIVVDDLYGDWSLKMNSNDLYDLKHVIECLLRCPYLNKESA